MIKTTKYNAPGEKRPYICAAGLPSKRSENTIPDCLNYYFLQHEVDALIGDSIKPDPKPPKLPPLRRTLRDFRHVGPYAEAGELINPPVETKFQKLREELKNTVYSSYWKAEVGARRDLTSVIPEGFDSLKTPAGKKVPRVTLYDVIMPKNPVPDKTTASNYPGYQTNRNYCDASFNADYTFGIRAKVDPSGKLMKCCLREDRILIGMTNPPITTRQADFTYTNRNQLGKHKVLCDNIRSVPPGFSFGKIEPPCDHVPECLTPCEINSKRAFVKECLQHLNTLRIALKKRFPATFFNSLYLELKFFDKKKSGWLHKDLVYDICYCKSLRFKPKFLDPLLTSWNILNGSEIKFGLFLDVLNHTKVIPELPLVRDVPEDCVEYCTTYSEMTNLDQKPDTRRRAGVPSGRYIDKNYPVTPNGYCKADRAYLPQESDAKSCLSPSLYTLYGVSHRDMYAERTPAVIKRVFEATGEKFTDEQFETVWNIAKQEHSEGIVCYETFNRALNKTKSAI